MSAFKQEVTDRVEFCYIPTENFNVLCVVNHSPVTSLTARRPSRAIPNPCIEQGYAPDYGRVTKAGDVSHDDRKTLGFTFRAHSRGATCPILATETSPSNPADQQVNAVAMGQRGQIPLTEKTNSIRDRLGSGGCARVLLGGP